MPKESTKYIRYFPVELVIYISFYIMIIDRIILHNIDQPFEGYNISNPTLLVAVVALNSFFIFARWRTFSSFGVAFFYCGLWIFLLMYLYGSSRALFGFIDIWLSRDNVAYDQWYLILRFRYIENLFDVFWYGFAITYYPLSIALLISLYKEAKTVLRHNMESKVQN